MKKKKHSRIITKNIVIPLIDTMLDVSGVKPVIKLAWLPIKISYGTLKDYYPNEAESFKEGLKAVVGNDSSYFETPEAIQALAVTLGALNRIRSQKKRDAVKAIYLGGFIPTEDKKSFELERMYNIIEMISIEALEHLKFLASDIASLKDKMVKEKVESMNKKQRENDDKWWTERESKLLHDSVVIDKWIYNNYNPNSKKILSKDPDANSNHTKISKYGEEERRIREHFFELESELMSYGVLMTQGGTYDSGFSFSISEFGRKFATFIEKLT